MNPIQAWRDLSHDERLSIAWTTVMILAVTVIILYAIAASRGQDVDYFKHRLGLMEQRINYMDHKLDTMAQRQVEHRDTINEIRRMKEAHERQLEEQQRWIEHWKTLPQLPKPPARR
jgi:sensor domain CHASE-containing protein